MVQAPLKYFSAYRQHYKYFRGVIKKTLLQICNSVDKEGHRCNVGKPLRQQFCAIHILNAKIYS
jgi:hypothetical protein